MKLLLSFSLGLLILAAVPAARAESDQCPASSLMISTTDHAPADDQCHFQSMPNMGHRAPRVTARANGSVCAAVFRTWTRAPHDLQGAAACRLNVAPRADMPILMLTEVLLI
jgi:hypothetical protein